MLAICIYQVGQRGVQNIVGVVHHINEEQFQAKKRFKEDYGSPTLFSLGQCEIHVTRMYKQKTRNINGKYCDSQMKPRLACPLVAQKEYALYLFALKRFTSVARTACAHFGWCASLWPFWKKTDLILVIYDQPLCSWTNVILITWDYPWRLHGGAPGEK